MLSGELGSYKNNFDEIQLPIHLLQPTLCDLALLKTFQKRNVSSPAPVTIVCPSGDIAYGMVSSNKNTLLQSNI